MKRIGEKNFGVYIKQLVVFWNIYFLYFKDIKKDTVNELHINVLGYNWRLCVGVVKLRKRKFLHPFSSFEELFFKE